MGDQAAMKRSAKISSLAALALAGFALAAGDARAQLASGKGPIDVTADQLEMIDAQHLAIWRGNVEALQNGNRLVSDVLNVFFSGKSAAGPTPAAAQERSHRRTASRSWRPTPMASTTATSGIAAATPRAATKTG